MYEIIIGFGILCFIILTFILIHYYSNKNSKEKIQLLKSFGFDFDYIKETLYVGNQWYKYTVSKHYPDKPWDDKDFNIWYNYETNETKTQGG